MIAIGSRLAATHQPIFFKPALKRGPLRWYDFAARPIAVACSGVSVRITRAGEPMMREFSGNCLPSVTTEPAPTTLPRPILAAYDIQMFPKCSTHKLLILGRMNK